MFRRTASIILAASIASIGLAALAAPAHADSAPVEVEPTTQVVEVVGTSETVTREDVIVTPAPEPIDVPAIEAPVFPSCGGDLILVEDGSCVPPSFFDEVPSLAVANLLPCVEEDSVEDCYWDARVRGNGLGTSFVIVGGVQYLLLP